MYHHKTGRFSTENTAEIDQWLNDFSKKGYGVKIVSSIPVGPALDYVMITILLWEKGHLPSPDRASGERMNRTTIDEIPEEPTINYDQHAEA